MDRFIPVVDRHPTLIDLGSVDPGQDVGVELLPLELRISWVAPGVGEQVHGKALAVTIRPEHEALHPRLDVLWNWEYAFCLGPQAGTLPPVFVFVAATVYPVSWYYLSGDTAILRWPPTPVFHLSRSKMVFADLGPNFGQGEIGDKSQCRESPDGAGYLAQVIAAKTGPGAGDWAGVKSLVTFAGRAVPVGQWRRTTKSSIGAVAEVQALQEIAQPIL